MHCKKTLVFMGKTFKVMWSKTCLFLVLVPPAHVEEHGENWLQGDQPPFKGREPKKKVFALLWSNP